MLSRVWGSFAGSGIMRAIRVESFGGPEVLKLRDSLPLPEIGSREVLISVKSISINPVDTYIRAGQYSRLPTLPYTPGNDCSGVVEGVGTEVKMFKPGDRVYSLRALTGSYSTHAVCDTDYVNLLPDCLPFQEGSCLGTAYYTAYRALTAGSAKPGQLVLVHGASGGVGTACLQLCRLLGIRAVGTAGTGNGEKAAGISGAERVVNHREEGYMDALKELSRSNGGFNVIVENAAHINLDGDLDLVANRGSIVVVGSKGMESVAVVPRKLMAKQCSITGVMLGSISPTELVQYHAAVRAGVESGVLKPVINRVFELGEAGKAHELIMSGQGAAGQIVLVP